MKTVISRIKLGAVLCIAALIATSCLKDSNSGNLSFSGFFTITGSMPNYKLLGDDGTIVYPTVESVNSLTDNKGFGTQKRAQFYCTFNEENKTTDESGNAILKEVRLLGGQYIETAKVLDMANATKLNLLNNDSLFSVMRFSQCWVANGYINTSINGQYSVKEGKAIRPTVNLFVNENSIKENEVTFTILYNRHSTKNENAAGTADFINSFDMSDVHVPGNDSVLVTVSVLGANSFKAKVPRREFK